MSKDRYVKTTVNAGRDLKERLVSRCEDADIGMNDLLVRAMAEKVGVQFEPSGRNWPRPQAGTSPTIMLSVPAKVHSKVRHYLVDHNLSMRAFVIGVAEDELSKPFARAA